MVTCRELILFESDPCFGAEACLFLKSDNGRNHCSKHLGAG